MHNSVGCDGKKTPTLCGIIQFTRDGIRCTNGILIDTTLSFDTEIDVKVYDAKEKNGLESMIAMKFLFNMTPRKHLPSYGILRKLVTELLLNTSTS